MRIMEKAPDFVVSDALGFAVLNTFSLRPKGHGRQQEIVESTLNKCVIRYLPQLRMPTTSGTEEKWTTFGTRVIYQRPIGACARFVKATPMSGTRTTTGTGTSLTTDRLGVPTGRTTGRSGLRCAGQPLRASRPRTTRGARDLPGSGSEVREGGRLKTTVARQEADQLDPHQLHTKRNGQARQRLTVSEPSKGCAVSGSSFAGLDLRAQLPRTASRPTGGTL